MALPSMQVATSASTEQNKSLAFEGGDVQINYAPPTPAKTGVGGLVWGIVGGVVLVALAVLILFRKRGA